MNKNLRLVAMTLINEGVIFSFAKDGKIEVEERHEFKKKIIDREALKLLLDFCDKYNFEFMGLFYKHKETCIYAVREKGAK